MRCLIRIKLNANENTKLQDLFTDFNRRISENNKISKTNVSNDKEQSLVVQKFPAQANLLLSPEQSVISSKNIQSEIDLSETTNSNGNAALETNEESQPKTKTKEASPDKNSETYENTIIKIFRRLGYESIPNVEKDNEIVTRIFKDVPDEVTDEELPRLVFVSYTSEGQIHFVVCAIQHDTLHIRARAETFQRIARFCEEIYRKTPSFIPRLWRRKSQETLQLQQIIDILEPGQHSATIRGKIVGGFISGLRETYKDVKVNIYLTLIGFLSLIPLYATNSFASIFPAVVLFIATNIVPIITTYVKYLSSRPIDWNNINKDTF